MKTLSFDSIGGASGDMILAALLDLGVDPANVEESLSGLGLGEIRLNCESSVSRGLSGSAIQITVDGKVADAGGEQPHRHLSDIKSIIKKSSLPEAVKAMSEAVFIRLAAAEASVHGTTVEKIHFHEVGAVDSIADIVGACLALHELHVDEIGVGALPLGRGTIECAHGTYPCPAPATLALLKGWTVQQTKEPFELVTPTGAALLMEWATPAERSTGMRIVRSGMGVGRRTLSARPNVLRATLMEGAQDSSEHDQCLVLQCNLDDTNPELIGSLLQQLIDAGALDAFSTSVQMKKQRPGVLVTVLCREEDRDRFVDMIFKESTTFGLREHMTSRTILRRELVPVSTPYGDVSVKLGYWKGDLVTCSPEMDDCIRLAREKGVSVREIYESASALSGELKNR